MGREFHEDNSISEMKFTQIIFRVTATTAIKGMRLDHWNRTNRVKALTLKMLIVCKTQD